MAREAEDLAPPRQASLVDELHEDLDVAIREFLERHPSTSNSRVRKAIRLVERGLPGGRARGEGAIIALFALLTAFGVGVVLGFLVG